MIPFDPKILFAVGAAVVGIAAFIPYVRDMLRGTTRPHAYTWLIWTLTQGTATAGLWYGGGGYAAVGLSAGTAFIFITFLLSLAYGTKNITASDTGVLLLALAAILFWWLFNSPLLAVTIVTVADALGYAPSIRKSFEEPWSESLVTWGMFTLSALLSILALGAYTPLTLMYLVMSVSLNIALMTVCLTRRHSIPKPV